MWKLEAYLLKFISVSLEFALSTKRSGTAPVKFKFHEKLDNDLNSPSSVIRAAHCLATSNLCVHKRCARSRSLSIIIHRHLVRKAAINSAKEEEILDMGN